MVNNTKTPYCSLCRRSVTEYDVWIRTNVGNIIRCKKCGLGFLNLKNKDILKDLNTSIYNTKTYYETINRQLKQLTNRYKKQIKGIIQLVKNKGILADIGCGIGLFLNMAAFYGFKPYGYDINKINLKKAKKYFSIKILHDNYLDNKKNKNLFDVATLWDVLEHMKDPVEYLSKLISIIKPGGLLVVQCPSMESYEFLKFKSKWIWLTPGDHLQFFTPKTLAKVVISAGFIPIKIKIWIEPLTFSSVMLSSYDRDLTLLFNRFLSTVLRKLKSFFQKVELNIPFEKIQGLYGWILQMLYHGGHRHSLIKILATKPQFT